MVAPCHVYCITIFFNRQKNTWDESCHTKVRAGNPLTPAWREREESCSEFCAGDGEREAEDASSARQSRAQAQGISEQMASLVMTARTEHRDSVWLRNKLPLGTLGNYFKNKTHKLSLTPNNTASFLNPVNKQPCVLIFMAKEAADL